MDAATRRRTLRLTERTADECRLPPADVAFLLAGHRNHLELEPTGRQGRYRLTPANHVGTIVAPGCRLVIRPKVPLENFLNLLDPTAPVPSSEDRTAVSPGTEALDFMAGRLARLLAERAAAGLHRAYTERVDQGPFLQGRLDLAAQFRAAPARKDRLHCRYEDFTADVPCNQVPKATAELVLRSPLLGDKVRTTLRRALDGFAAVSAFPLRPETFNALALDRLSESYRPLLAVCRLLAEGLTTDDTAGRFHHPAFLLDMERVFERYVGAGVVAAFQDVDRYRVQLQPLHTISRPVAGQPDLQIRPDVLIERAGLPLLVVDAKWKAWSGSPLVTADVYQMLAYCTALGVRQAVLVYPGRKNQLWTYPLDQAPIRLEVRTLRVVGPWERCRTSLQRLGATLRKRPPGTSHRGT